MEHLLHGDSKFLKGSEGGVARRGSALFVPPVGISDARILLPACGMPEAPHPTPPQACSPAAVAAADPVNRAHAAAALQAAAPAGLPPVPLPPVPPPSPIPTPTPLPLRAPAVQQPAGPWSALLTAHGQRVATRGCRLPGANRASDSSQRLMTRRRRIASPAWTHSGRPFLCPAATACSARPAQLLLASTMAGHEHTTSRQGVESFIKH